MSTLSSASPPSPPSPSPLELPHAALDTYQTRISSEEGLLRNNSVTVSDDDDSASTRLPVLHQGSALDSPRLWQTKHTIAMIAGILILGKCKGAGAGACVGVQLKTLHDSDDCCPV